MSPASRGRTRRAKWAAEPVDDLVGHVSGNAIGPHLFGDPVRLFADPDPGPDEISFHEPNVDEQYYNTGYYFTHKNEIQPFPRPLPDPPLIDLAQILGPNLIDPIVAANKISFHAVGDTGANTPKLIRPEASVADAIAADVQPGDTAAPAFLFHLGDVVYSFGEGQYYYDQFYEPFRAYDRPIFAVGGNHDGAVYGPNVDAPVAPTLQAFLRNFCASAPGPSPDAPGVARTTMTQPGVYFTLDAPCVSIIGLYSNVLEHPGVISSQNGHFPLPDDQLTFLANELTRLKPERDAMKRVIVFAVHHPPVSFDATHGSSPVMANEIDAVCNSAGVWPDLVLSGHAHLYQRFTRTLGGRAIPYLVSGSGGHLAHAPRTDLPPAGEQVGNYTMEVQPIFELGYVTITVDLGANPPTITGKFNSVADPPRDDGFVLNLETGAIATQ
jgi:Calcineurin-like phosphoesterase